MNSTITTSSTLSVAEQEQLIAKLEVFSIQGRSRHGHSILRVIGNVFPAKLVKMEALKRYLEENIFPTLAKSPFSVVYIHTGVERSRNFPGLLALRSICNAIPDQVRENLDKVYFLHPGLQSRLLLSIFFPVLVGTWLYQKFNFMNRLHLLWREVRRHEIEIPEFVYDHDEELELQHHRSMVDYGIESDQPRNATYFVEESAIAVYSMRCIP